MRVSPCERAGRQGGELSVLKCWVSNQVFLGVINGRGKGYLLL